MSDPNEEPKLPEGIIEMGNEPFSESQNSFPPGLEPAPKAFHLGNNRFKAKKAVKRALAKMAAKSRRINRRKK